MMMASRGVCGGGVRARRRRSPPNCRLLAQHTLNPRKKHTHAHKKRLPPDWRLALSTAGRSGEKVLPAMQERFARALDEAAANGLFYDWVVLLGGTNDVGTGEAAAFPFSLLGLGDVAIPG